MPAGRGLRRRIDEGMVLRLASRTDELRPRLHGRPGTAGTRRRKKDMLLEICMELCEYL